VKGKRTGRGRPAAGRCGRCGKKALKVTPQTQRYTGSYRLKLECRSCGFVEYAWPVVGRARNGGTRKVPPFSFPGSSLRGRASRG